MKKKKAAGVLIALVLCLCLISPMGTSAASRVRVKTVKGVTTSYSGKKTYCYVNNKKISLKKTPIFLKSGSYMGSVTSIFKNSTLGVKVIYKGEKLILKYGSNKVRLKADSRVIVTNGVKSTMAAAAVHGTYTSSGKKRWIVPLKSVCSRLGITYKLSNGVIRISGNTNSSSDSTESGSSSSNSGKIVITLDAGHGGSDSGATGNSLAEKNLNLAIILAAKKYFDDDSKFKVYYTRTSDTYPSLSERYKLANNSNSDFFISVHINSASASAHGTETLWNPNRNSTTAKKGLTSKELATEMHSGAVSATGFTNRGLKSRTDLAVLNGTKMPACLIEYGFITNSTEAKKMKVNSSVYGKALYRSVVNLMKEEGRY